MRELEGKRVRMRFDDGPETAGRLLSAVQDMDGSEHLINDHGESASEPREFASAKDSTIYAEGESLVSIEDLDADA